MKLKISTDKESTSEGSGNLNALDRKIITERNLNSNLRQRLTPPEESGGREEKSELCSDTYRKKPKVKFSFKNVNFQGMAEVNNTKEKKMYENLNFENIAKADFNDEFILNYDEFSPSWREACERINLKKKHQS